jgi:hypothetical protein
MFQYSGANAGACAMFYVDERDALGAAAILVVDRQTVGLPVVLQHMVP